MREREREGERERGRDIGRGRSRLPDVGLDLTTPGSRPVLKAEAQLLSHPGFPRFRILKSYKRRYWNHLGQF